MKRKFIIVVVILILMQLALALGQIPESTDAKGSGKNDVDS